MYACLDASFPLAIAMVSVLLEICFPHPVGVAEVKALDSEHTRELSHVAGNMRGAFNSLDRLDMFSDPVENLGEAEFASLHRARDKCVSVQTFDLNIKAVASQENISSGKCDALVSVKEDMVVGERFHQSGSLFFDRGVIAGLWTKNCSLHSTLIADTLKAAEDFD
jgi:hypothetical protein